MGRLAELVEKGCIALRNLGLFLVKQPVFHPCSEQQFQVETRRLRDAKIGRDGLALDGRLDFTVFDVAPE